jgi:large subunit ribosomal protein L19
LKLDKDYLEDSVEIIKEIEKEFISDKSEIDFKAGDTVTVSYRIQEGNKTRIQKYKGVVIQRKGGNSASASFTVRKISANGIAVERIFPLHSPLIDSLEVEMKGKVRQARIYYMRERTGKAARIKEIKTTK